MQELTNSYYIEVRKHSDDSVVRTIQCDTTVLDIAQRVDDGMQVNMNHHEFYTVLERN